MKLTAFKYSLLATISFLVLSCSNDCNNHCVEKKLDCKCCPTIEVPANKKPSVQSVIVFLETSASMKGYMPSGNVTTSFQQVVPNFISKLSSITNSIFIIPNSTQRPQPISSRDLMMNITDAKFQWGQYTSIPVMLDTINNYQNENVVTVLISDMIYSPKEEKEVSQTVTEISEKVKAQDAACSLVSTTSGFEMTNGTQVEQAPYYLLFRGKPENIEAVKSKLFNSFILYNQQYQEVNFGYKYSSPFYSIIPYAQNSGKGVPQDCPDNSGRYLLISDLKSNSDLSFWVGVDLASLPAYTLDERYLKQNLQVSGDGCTITVDKVLRKEKFESIISDDEDKALAKKCTHFIHLNVSVIEDNISTADISLLNKQPDWIEKYNHDDESKADYIRSQTFGLRNIYTALSDAYDEPGKKNLFKELEISLKK